ncbi:class I SAM-dependent methyltransferase [Bdellovibrionota bacterium FG-2]
MHANKPTNKYEKYALYESSVQSPEHHAQWFVQVYKELRGRYPRSLREDFCGTARVSCEWVKRNRQNTAVGVDLDKEPLTYSKRHHIPMLTAEQKTRMKLLEGDVLTTSTNKVDVLIACNFSYSLFQKRETLVRYLRVCAKSIKKNGMAILDLAGGPGMIMPMRERKTINDPKLGKFTYIWHQKSFDPVTQRARYGIHFKFPSGRLIENAFTYDWRLWGIPELRDAMMDAGFKKTCVYWETSHKGEGTGEYARTDVGDNAYAWVAYVIGMNE